MQNNALQAIGARWRLSLRVDVRPLKGLMRIMNAWTDRFYRRAMVVVFLMCAAVLSGCATARVMYTGPTRDVSEIAAVLSDNRQHSFFEGRVAIMAVDGVSTSLRHISDGGARAVHVLPGPHMLTLTYRRGSSIAGCMIPLNTDAGGTYHVRYSIKSSRVTFWIEDDSGGVVSGQNPVM